MEDLTALLDECRYCSSSDNQMDLISPCDCNGTSKYVHKACLLKWFDRKNEGIPIPALPRQYDILHCEICNYKYDIVFTRGEGSKCDLYKEIFIKSMVITIALFCLYVVFGTILESYNTLLVDRNSYVENVLLNGFMLTHIIITLLYIIVSIVFSALHSTCFCFGCDVPDATNEYFFLVMLIVCSLLLVFLVYFDIISRVIERHRNRQMNIIEIKNK